MSYTSVINDEQTEFDNRMSNFSFHHEQFEEIQYERNYLNTMIKISNVNSDAETIVVEPSGLTVIKIEKNDEVKGYEYNRVFGQEEGPKEMFNYFQYYCDCILDGEDCNIIGYGGRKTSKSKTLFGNIGQSDGIVYYLLSHINELISYKNMEGRLTMSMFIIDNKDSVYDGFGQDKPIPFSLKVSKERYTSSNKKEYKSEILDTSLLTRILIDDINKAINFIISRLLHSSLKGKIGSTILNINFDGEDNNRIISGRLNVIEILNSEWLTRSEIAKNPFHTLLDDLVNNEILKYATTNLTYILRDSLSKYVRTTLIGFVSPVLHLLDKTISTISTIGCVYKRGNLVDLGEPLQRQIYKFYENDKITLERLYNQLKAEDNFLSEEIKSLIESKYCEHKCNMMNLKTEIDLANSLWDQEIEKLTVERNNMKEKQKKYKEQQQIYYNERIKKLKDQEILEKQFLDKLDEIDTINTELEPLKYDAEKVNEELLPLQQKSKDLKNKTDDIDNQLNTIKSELATIEESQSKKGGKRTVTKTITTTTTTTTKSVKK